MPPIPQVQLGMQTVQLPDGRQVQVPKAFMDRIKYDLAGSGQQGRFTPEDMLLRYFGGGRGAQAQPGQPQVYRGYADPNPYLQKMKPLYSGQGRMVQTTQPYQRAEQLGQRRQEQQIALRPSGAARKMKVDPSGRMISDTGQKITQRDVSRAYQKTRKPEKKLQNQLMQDVQQMKRIGKTRAVSNLPVALRKNTADDSEINKRVKRQEQLQRQAIPSTLPNQGMKPINQI